MKPEMFAQSNVIYAVDQPEYLPLPAYRDERQTITRWSLTWGERLHLLVTGRLWLRQLNFGKPLQPQLPQVTSPWSISPSEQSSPEEVR